MSIFYNFNISFQTIDVTSLGDDGLSYGDLWKIRMLYNYISRNRPTIGKSECSKLFVPGSQFNNYRPDSGEDLTPRKKPNKYLGNSDNDDTEEQLEKSEQSDHGTDNNTGNDKQSGSDGKPSQFSDVHKDEDVSDENTIYRSHKRT